MQNVGCGRATAKTTGLSSTIEVCASAIECLHSCWPCGLKGNREMGDGLYWNSVAQDGLELHCAKLLLRCVSHCWIVGDWRSHLTDLSRTVEDDLGANSAFEGPVCDRGP